MVVYRDENVVKDDLLQTFEVELTKKPGKGLGLSLLGRKNASGIYVSDIVNMAETIFEELSQLYLR